MTIINTEERLCVRTCVRVYEYQLCQILCVCTVFGSCFIDIVKTIDRGHLHITRACASVCLVLFSPRVVVVVRHCHDDSPIVFYNLITIKTSETVNIFYVSTGRRWTTKHSSSVCIRTE